MLMQLVLSTGIVKRGAGAGLITPAFSHAELCVIRSSDQHVHVELQTGNVALTHTHM